MSFFLIVLNKITQFSAIQQHCFNKINRAHGEDHSDTVLKTEHNVNVVLNAKQLYNIHIAVMMKGTKQS